MFIRRGGGVRWIGQGQYSNGRQRRGGDEKRVLQHQMIRSRLSNNCNLHGLIYRTSMDMSCMQACIIPKLGAHYSDYKPRVSNDYIKLYQII